MNHHRTPYVPWLRWRIITHAVYDHNLPVNREAYNTRSQLKKESITGEPREIVLLIHTLTSLAHMCK